MASICIPDEVKDRLDQLAASQEQPTDVLVARAVTKFLEREGAIDAEVLQALREDGRQAWAAFEGDGLHLIGEDMGIWLASWGTRGETPMPKCHTSSFYPRLLSALTKVEKILPPHPGLTAPVCIAGANACPPENCGGTPGYEEFLEAINDPKHEDHNDMLAWCGGSFDSTTIDLGIINASLSEIKL